MNRKMVFLDWNSRSKFVIVWFYRITSTQKLTPPNSRDFILHIFVLFKTVSIQLDFEDSKYLLKSFSLATHLKVNRKNAE